MRQSLVIAIVLTGIVSACGQSSHVESRTEADSARVPAIAPGEQPVSESVPAPGKKLFLDVHRLGPGKVTAEAAAAAHQKDLAAQSKHDVRYLKYWVDLERGAIFCLSEAPSADAALAVHREAHGLMPDSIEQVSEGK